MPILLTGASGYVGGAIAQTLEKANLPVLRAGRTADDAISLDLLCPDAIARLVLPPGLEVMVHAAALNEIACHQDPVAAYTANVTATRALIQAGLTAGIRRFVYLSTFHVFGTPRGDVAESTVPLAANDYGLSHLMAEQLAVTTARAAGATVHILRPGNLYGEPADWTLFRRWTLAPFDFVRQAMTRGVIALRSDGAPVRSYVSLDQCGAAVIAAAWGTLPPITHVAGRAWSMRDLAALAAVVVEKETGRAVTVTYGGATTSEPPYRFLSRSWRVEEDAGGKKMRAFLRAVVRRLRDHGEPPP